MKKITMVYLVYASIEISMKVGCYMTQSGYIAGSKAKNSDICQRTCNNIISRKDSKVVCNKAWKLMNNIIRVIKERKKKSKSRFNLIFYFKALCARVVIFQGPGHVSMANMTRILQSSSNIIVSFTSTTNRGNSTCTAHFTQ